MSNAVYEQVVAHLNAGADKRIVIGTVGIGKLRVYAAKHLSLIKAEGAGLRIGKAYVFASQVNFAKVA